MQTLTPPAPVSYRPLFSLPVIVSALGFFVDVYDLLIFSIVRVPSLQSFGLSEEDVSRSGTLILNCQQAGLMLGGILWGIWGDKRGRLAVLFGSIITYSLANIACGFVQDIHTYALLRFIAGIGLSGEIGAAITLVAELLPKQIRGYGTAMVAGIGYLGAGVAYLTVEWFSWRTAFFVGGGMGLALLLLRIRVFESGIFRNLKTQAVERGNYLTLLTSRKALIKYSRCIAVGVPTWFVVGILGTFGNEFGKALGVTEPVQAGRCVTLIYLGFAAGDLLSGPFSQWLQSRRKAIAFLLLSSAALSVVCLSGLVQTATALYGVYALLGFCTGYIALYLTTIAEQYGTNLRATATTSASSVVRGSVILMTLTFQSLKPSIGVLATAAILGVCSYGLALWALSRMEETYGKDMEFVE